MAFFSTTLFVASSNADVIVIAVSASVQEFERRLSIYASCDAFLAKPVQEESLNLTLQHTPLEKPDSSAIVMD